MPRFQNILVGVDLLQADQAGLANFSPPVEEAIKHGLWLAEKTSATITFFSAVEVPQDDRYAQQPDEESLARRIEQAGRAVLEELVERAAARGVRATLELARGEGWIEITRSVLRRGHDLVIVGTRNLGAVQRFLFGSTAMKLLHNCPCPVWITRPEQRPMPTNLLVASDFSAVSDEALRLGQGVGSLTGARVNLLHAVDYPLDRLWSTGLLDSSTRAYHDQVRADARQALEEQLSRVSPGKAAGGVEIHVVEGLSIADNAILEFVECNHIDLLL
ncbi:MAG: universal stress protein, partial [Candidatus Saccharimonadales bacterium]